MKQVSTPWSTRVRMSDWAPFTVGLLGGDRVGGLGGEDRPRVEDAAGVEGRLDPAHELELHRVLEIGVGGQLRRADPVLARDGAAEAHGRGQDVVEEPMADHGVGLEDREVDVAVADVPTADHQRAGRRGQLGDVGQVGRDRGPGHHRVDDVVGAGRLGRPERLLPGRDEVVAGVVGQHVDVERAELGELVGDRRGVLLDPVVVVVLEDDDQVGERRLADGVRDPEVDAGVGRDPGHRHHVDVLDEQGTHAAGHDRRHGLGHLVRRWRTGPAGWRGGRAGDGGGGWRGSPAPACPRSRR